MNRQMQEFVEEQSSHLNHQDLVDLAARLPALRERISRLDRLEYPQLAEQYEFLALIVEDCSQEFDCKVPEVCQHEAAFALLYLEMEGDVLPDDLPGFGMIDDQAVVATVLHKHRVAFRACPRGYLFQWVVEPVDFDRMVLDRLHRRFARFRSTAFVGAK